MVNLESKEVHKVKIRLRHLLIGVVACSEPQPCAWVAGGNLLRNVWRVVYVGAASNIDPNMSVLEA